ncbi:MAG: hypothetical protein VB018_00030 [Lachnospiraceae bacterium]|nr:hypothetical protein [Lachnospiraceae bacterium]
MACAKTLCKKQNTICFAYKPDVSDSQRCEKPKDERYACKKIKDGENE